MISVVIPAYDEATALGWLLPGLPVRLHGRTVRPLVVNDGSTDGTPELARAHGVAVPALSPHPGQSAPL